MISNTTLEIYGIVVFIFFVLDKDNKLRFFEKSFQLAYINSDIIIGMPFLTMSNADIDFQTRNFL